MYFENAGEKCMISCRACASNNLFPLLDLGKHPIAHHFPTHSNETEFTHPIVLFSCEGCGLTQILDPVPAERLYKEYVCLSSWKPQPHVPRLLALIGELPHIQKGSRILEIGCNDGSFLQVLRSEGFTNLLGIEPAEDAFAAAEKRGFDVIDGFFDKEMVRGLCAKNRKFELIIARQVLEHVTDLDSFLDGIVSLLLPGGHVLIEVPDFDFSLREWDYSAIWEEHVNYFCQKTLHGLLSRKKIKVVNEETANFSGQALVVLGRLSERPLLSEAMITINEERIRVLSYRDRWPLFCRELRQFLKHYKDQGKRIALYGGGNRACALINFVGLKEFLDFVVDDQKEKQGKLMPGSLLRIFPPEALKENSIDLCLLAVNAENEDKVISRFPLAEPNRIEFVSVLPPSPHLPPFWKTI